MAFYIPTGQIGSGAVCVYMVGTVLCIIFYDEYDAVLPYRAFADVFYQPANSQVVICYMRERCGPAGSRPPRYGRKACGRSSGGGRAFCAIRESKSFSHMR